MLEDERWTAVLLPPTRIVDSVEGTGKDTMEDTGKDTGKDTVEDTGKDTGKDGVEHIGNDTVKDTADNIAKKTMDGIAKGGVGESDKSSETVEQFITRLGLNREEAEVVEDLLKTHDFIKEKDLIESVIRTARD